ncbi:hemerythrin domain-containing protein [Micromonospora purpureochromogenes]|uniref:hemerythrin domain-containing protein n=1 Tax=Micromonospora purpureochromogenes TaxID=47872 RepID=UPI0033DAD876
MHPSTEPGDRLTALGNQLIEIHLWLPEELAEQAPQLRPVLDELAADQEVIAAVLRRIEELAADPAGVDGVRAELDGLSALLESHFVYEEKKLLAALNAVRGGTTEELLGVPLPE